MKKKQGNPNLGKPGYHISTGFNRVCQSCLNGIKKKNRTLKDIKCNHCIGYK